VVSETRAVRIAERIYRDLAVIFVTRIQDPRLTGVIVTDVKVDRELSYATVFVSAVEGSARAPDILAGLEHAQGFLRSELAQNIDLRHFPRLRFRWDPTPERAEAMERLLSSLEESGQDTDLVEPDVNPDEERDE